MTTIVCLFFRLCFCFFILFYFVNSYLLPLFDRALCYKDVILFPIKVQNPLIKEFFFNFTTDSIYPAQPPS